MKIKLLLILLLSFSQLSAQKSNSHDKTELILGAKFTKAIINESENIIGLNIQYGSQCLSKYLTLGMGTELNYFLLQENLLMPFFVYSRLSFAKQKSIPFVQIKYGQSFNFMQRFQREGFYFGIGLGYGYQFSKKQVFELILSVDSQRFVSYYQNVTSGELFIGPSLNIGLKL